MNKHIITVCLCLIWLLLSPFIGAVMPVDAGMYLPDISSTATYDQPFDSGSHSRTSIAPLTGNGDESLRRYADSHNMQASSLRLVKDYGDVSANIAIYRDTVNDAYVALVTQAPMAKPDKSAISTQWYYDGFTYHSTGNTYDASITDDGEVSVTLPFGNFMGQTKAGATISYHPTVTLDGKPLSAKSLPTLVTHDYLGNDNYINNCILINYGNGISRLYRQIEGQLQGYWILTGPITGNLEIHYNQTGDFKLALGACSIDEDTELVTPEYVNERSTNGWPVIITDSLTVYPDAHPETNTVDGVIGLVYSAGSGQTWTTLVNTANANNIHDDSTEDPFAQFTDDSNADKWKVFRRSIFLFNTADLPDDCIITNAVFSVYGKDKGDANNNTPTLNVYSSAPAGNTGLVAGDFDSLGSTPFSDSPITYAAFDTAGYNDLTLNAAGRAAISKTGVTKLGCRFDYDVNDTQPSWAANGNSSYMYGYYAEEGAGFQPKLVITYFDAVAPTVATNPPVLKTTCGALTAYGTISDAGSGSPSTRGFCYTIGGTPTTANDTVSEAWDGGTGSYSLSINGLTIGQTYSIRAYAVSDAGTGYGSVQQIETVCLPTVETGVATDITHDKFTMSGIIDRAGSGTPNDKGFCWSIVGTPTVTDDYKVLYPWDGATGSYTGEITGLSHLTTYYLRAYIDIESGSYAYGDVVEVTTADIVASGSGTCTCDLTDVQADIEANALDISSIMEDMTMVGEVLLLALVVIMAFWKQDLLLYFAGAMGCGMQGIIWFHDNGAGLGFPVIFVSLVLLIRALKQLWENRAKI